MYTVKTIRFADAMRLFRDGEFRIAWQISRVLTRHAIKTTPLRVRYGTRRVLLRAAARLA